MLFYLSVSYRAGVFPSCWNASNVTPIPKKIKSGHSENYLIAIRFVLSPLDGYMFPRFMFLHAARIFRKDHLPIKQTMYYRENSYFSHFQEQLSVRTCDINIYKLSVHRHYSLFPLTFFLKSIQCTAVKKGASAKCWKLMKKKKKIERFSADLNQKR